MTSWLVVGATSHNIILIYYKIYQYNYVVCPCPSWDWRALVVTFGQPPSVATQYSWSCFSITSDYINGVQIVRVQALSRVLHFPPHSSVSGHTREGLDRGSCHSCMTNMHLPHSYPHEYHSRIDIKNYRS